MLFKNSPLTSRTCLQDLGHSVHRIILHLLEDSVMQDGDDPVLVVVGVVFADRAGDALRGHAAEAVVVVAPHVQGVGESDAAADDCTETIIAVIDITSVAAVANGGMDDFSEMVLAYLDYPAVSVGGLLNNKFIRRIPSSIFHVVLLPFIVWYQNQE